ncbi:hypothetical protein ACEWY4_025329 [Coilia grayii]|uniref:Uncharacterized protein n=1 Tax=Coilia grayii TaxID=363190 RepID=A0ABD1IZB2_9TELE
MFVLIYCVLVSARVMDAEDLNTLSGELPAVTIDTCKTCTEIIDLLKDLLSDAGVQAMIKHDLDVVCEELGSPVPVKLCKEMVDRSLPLAFTMFNNAMKPGTLCPLLGLCVVEEDNRLQGLMTKLLTALKSPDLRVGFDLKCKFCVYLLELVESLLPVERTEAAVAHLLESVCNMIPPAYKHQCEAFIEMYSKKLIEMLLGKSSPHTICTLLHLCKDMEAPAFGSYMSGYACAMTSYKCRNLLTAVECGAVEFCQKNVWL